ncbi:MAG: hypothetical protein H7839_04980 [Magnetococcus sp. YQC-5]
MIGSRPKPHLGRELLDLTHHDPKLDAMPPLPDHKANPSSCNRQSDDFPLPGVTVCWWFQQHMKQLFWILDEKKHDWC